MKIFKGDIVNGIKENNTSHSSKQIESFDENVVVIDDLINEIKLKHEGNSKLTELISDIKERQITSFYDYLELANGVADEEVLNDKDLGRKIYLEAEKVAEGFDEYNNLADDIADEEILNDKGWARKIYLKAEKVAEGFDEYHDLAISISNTTGLNDKVWAKELFIKAIKEEKKTNDGYLFTLIKLTGYIVKRQFLGDKEFAIEIYKDIEKRLKFKEECIILAYEISINLKNKEWVEELFSKRSNLPNCNLKGPKKLSIVLQERLEKL